MTKVRTRFAPSPTGYLHIGGLRTALYAYIFAKQNNGDFLLRIEDTDRKRYVEGSIEKLISSLEWAGLHWDEGPAFNARGERRDKGSFGPYIQSERQRIYTQYVQKLIDNGKAYPCFCDATRLTKMREEQIAQKRAPMYDRHCLEHLDQEEVKKRMENNEPYTIRFKVPRDEIVSTMDLVRGEISFKAYTIDDQVLMKSDGFPTYHLASIVDDHLMEITHVIRGEEWLPSTPKHILLYQAFGWEVPHFAHLPLLLNADKSKLSKRQGDVAVEDYVQKGYLKDAIINFTSLLGWNPGEGSQQEIFSMEDLLEQFRIARVNKSGAVFDIQKLDWINAQYIKQLSPRELYEKTLPFLEKKEFYKQAPQRYRTLENVIKIVAVEQDRLERLDQVGENHLFFFEEPQVSEIDLKWKSMSSEDVRMMLQKALDYLQELTQDNWVKRETLEEKFLDAAEEKRGEFLWPLRVALTGEKKSPPPYDVAWVLGKEESMKRVKDALNACLSQ